MEKILCAAIWYKLEDYKVALPKNLDYGIVISGYRHAQCLSIFHNWFYLDYDKSPVQNQARLHFLNNSVQGFLTSQNRFVDREEAYKIAENAAQIVANFYKSELYSESLY